MLTSPTAAPPVSAARSPAPRSAWLVVLLAGAVCCLLVERALVATGDPALVPTGLLLGSAVVPAAALTFVWTRRLGFGVGARAVCGCAVVGGVLAVVVAGVLEADVQREVGSVGLAAVAAIEEASKLLVPLGVLLACRGRVTRADGLLLGVAAGAGFATLETMGYGFSSWLATHDDSVTGHLLVARSVLSPAGHLAWTGLAAAALYAAAAASVRRRWAVAGAGAAIALAVGLHLAWDGAPTTAALAGVAVAGLLAAGAQGLLAVRDQRTRLTDPAGAPRSTRPSPAGRSGR